MPTLLFADRDALRLALASGGLPPALTHAPALAGADATGRLWLRPETELPREAAAALGRLGVAILGGDADVLLAPVACWPQLLPLVPTEFPPPPATPALFEVPANRLARLVAEVRRAAPQSEFGFRLADLETRDSRVLLRVERPPFLVLLRAREDPHLAAYVEQAGGIWVEAGYRHPLAEQIKKPAGQLLLLRSPDHWSVRPDSPLVKELTTFTLSAGPPAEEFGGVRSIDSPLRLEDGGGDEPAELWVVHERPLEQLAGLAEEAGAGFLSRFRVAFVEPQDRTIILLWARPSKRQPPAPLLTALGCRPLLKLPNLFL
ncbi:MAG: hypothetical protein ACJ8F7_23415, partial [Gemmataceae bacterium]